MAVAKCPDCGGSDLDRRYPRTHRRMDCLARSYSRNRRQVDFASWSARTAA